MMNAHNWRRAVTDLQRRITDAEQRLCAAEARLDEPPTRPFGLDSQIYCARRLLAVCESENYVAPSIRELIEATLAKVERQVVALSPDRRPSLRLIRGRT